MNRSESLAILLTAVAVIKVSGGSPDVELPIYVDSKLRLIVPLADKYPEVWRSKGRPKGCHVNPGPFLRQHFGVDQCMGRDIACLAISPSSVQIATARHLASLHGSQAEQVINTRPTKGLRDSLPEIEKQTGCPTWLIPALWRFHGNADVLWFALQIECERVRKVKQQERVG